MIRTKKPTINDVARIAQVSKTTVSRYINKKFHLISSEKQERIKGVIQKLNYCPSQIAKGVKKGNTKLIAVIFSDIDSSYSVDVFKGIEKYATEKGYALLFFHSEDNIEKEIKILKLLPSYLVEGIIIQSVKPENYAIRLSNVPVVAIDREIKNYTCDLVGLNNEKAMEIIFEHLTASNFDTFLFITETIRISQARTVRYNSFKLLSEKYRPLISSSTIEIEDSNNLESLGRLIKLFIDKNDSKKISIISVNSKVTLNILYSLEKVNIQCGKDIGLISFDDPSWMKIISGGITVLSQPTYRIGYSACKLLIDRITGKYEDGYKTIYYSGILIERKSTTDMELKESYEK
ncbi:LacI family DNA-binding transcriptional regulator [Avibacterium avium]|uniref:LacI family DNA-binding transcriptional regulator n=1 Tax=Avibacterium avium TaxID=751 RepID=UPI003BF8E351